jgi:hypothetical protein
MQVDPAPAPGCKAKCATRQLASHLRCCIAATKPLHYYQLVLLEETTRIHNLELEIDDMIRKLSFLAIGFAAVTTASIAVAAPLPTANGGEVQTAPFMTPVSTSDSSDRVYCYNGVTGDQSNRYRGWVCQSEQQAAKTR